MRKLLLDLIVVCFTCFNVAGQSPMFKLIPKKASAGVTYATYNSSYKGTNVTLSGSNLVMSVTPTDGVACATIGSSTTGKSTGKWYWEIYNTTRGGNSSIGVTNSLTLNLNTFMGADTHGWAYYSNGGGSGGYWAAGSLTFGWADYGLGDVIGVALDAGGNQVSFYKNNTLIGTLSISGGNYFPANSCNVGTFTANYGASAFVYTPPSGYNSGFY